MELGWVLGIPENEGIYFCCFVSPYDKLKVLGDILITASGKGFYYGHHVEVFGYLKFPPCPFLDDPPSPNQKLKDKIRSKNDGKQHIS